MIFSKYFQGLRGKIDRENNVVKNHKKIRDSKIWFRFYIWISHIKYFSCCDNDLDGITILNLIF